MTDRRNDRDFAPRKPDNDARPFELQRIVLALLGLAGAAAVLAMNMRF